MIEINITEEIRKETLERFKSSKKYEYLPKNKYFSPDEKYYFEAETYIKPIDDGITYGNYFFLKIRIFETKFNTKIGAFLTNSPDVFHLWLSKAENHYLFLSEFRNGFSVFNLTSPKLESYISKNDWQQITQYHPSPDGNKLGVIKYSNNGYSLEILDCSEPMTLPLTTLYKKHLTEANSHYVENINWIDSFQFDIITKEQIRLGKVSVKVKVVSIADEGHRLQCVFKDVFGREYTCYEKTEAMLNFTPNQDTKWPLFSAIDVYLVRKYIENGQKLAVISTNINKDNQDSGEITVLENQLETYWYYKDFIK